MEQHSWLRYITLVCKVCTVASLWACSKQSHLSKNLQLQENMCAGSEGNPPSYCSSELMSCVRGFSLASSLFLATITADPLHEIICTVFLSSALIQESWWICMYGKHSASHLGVSYMAVLEFTSLSWREQFREIQVTYLGTNSGIASKILGPISSRYFKLYWTCPLASLFLLSQLFIYLSFCLRPFGMQKADRFQHTPPQADFLQVSAPCSELSGIVFVGGRSSASYE